MVTFWCFAVGPHTDTDEKVSFKGVTHDSSMSGRRRSIPPVTVSSQLKGEGEVARFHVLSVSGRGVGSSPRNLASPHLSAEYISWLYCQIPLPR